MSTLVLKVIDRNDKVKFVSCGEDEVVLVNTAAYQEGDRICLEVSESSLYVWLQMDDAVGTSLVYVTGNVDFHVPFGEKRVSYSPKAFAGDCHYLYARVAREDEVRAYRNLALNVWDCHENVHSFPHASANVETRGEAVFAARNAIDGVVANLAHGAWPYESWGINRRDDAAMTIDFGKEVRADKIVLYTRADFPHDSWWQQVKLSFSDGSEIVRDLEKSVKPHVITFAPKMISSVTLCNLIRADDPSPFPALSQMEVYGCWE
ncbi:MAG: carbohydrate-binding protein [Lachnospiraceae bacterium]|nr:carbohydrate-binding protein [Lachnospiraceae bacterium]